MHKNIFNSKFSNVALYVFARYRAKCETENMFTSYDLSRKRNNDRINWRWRQNYETFSLAELVNFECIKPLKVEHYYQEHSGIYKNVIQNGIQNIFCIMHACLAIDINKHV